MTEALGDLGREMRRGTLGVQVDDPNVAELAGAQGQSVEQDRWCRGTAVNKELLARLDAGDGVGRADDLHGGESSDGAAEDAPARSRTPSQARAPFRRQARAWCHRPPTS